MLTFDEKDHKYFWNGLPVPGVNEILTSLNLLESWGSEVDMLRGTYVHKACELYDLGTLDEDNLDPLIAGYLEGWKKFTIETGFKFLLNEHMFYSELGYAGRVDRYGTVNMDLCVLDIKTGDPGWITGMKLAGYEQLVRESWSASDPVGWDRPPTLIARLAIRLYDTGEWKPYYYKSRKDKAMFLSAVSLYHYRNNGGK
jgi:hypothetical protein